MKLHTKLRDLRRDLGHSQEAIGAQGFVSAPGWIKLENGQRDPSEKLIGQIVRYYVGQKVERKEIFKKDAANTISVLTEELLTLKYLGSRSPHVAQMARHYAKTNMPNGAALLEEPKLPQVVSKGRPKGSGKKKANTATVKVVDARPAHTAS